MRKLTQLINFDLFGFNFTVSSVVKGKISNTPAFKIPGDYNGWKVAHLDFGDYKEIKAVKKNAEETLICKDLEDGWNMLRGTLDKCEI